MISVEKCGFCVTCDTIQFMILSGAFRSTADCHVERYGPQFAVATFYTQSEEPHKHGVAGEAQVKRSQATFLT